MRPPRLRPALARLGVTKEVTARMFDGQPIRVVLPEIVGTELYRRGTIEPEVTRVLLERLRPGMVFVDVGAQYGYFTLLAHRLVHPGGAVVAFEPGRRAARLLHANAGHLDGVVIEQAAVHDRTGTVELTDFGAAHSALNTLLGTARVPTAERRTLRGATYRVPAVALDDYLARHGLRPDVVKLDAEGAELAILTGMRHTLRSARPLITLETGDYAGMASPSTAASIELLDRAGYRCFEYDGGLRPHHRRPSYGYGNLFFLPARDRGDAAGTGYGRRP